MSLIIVYVAMHMCLCKYVASIQDYCTYCIHVVYDIYIADRDASMYFIGCACIHGVALVGQQMPNHKGAHIIWPYIFYAISLAELL